MRGSGGGLSSEGVQRHLAGIVGQILPGLVGAIASFIFEAAGEEIGFLAKNAWLLIVEVVVYFVEKLKYRR